jgi:uncharacterized protein
VANLVGVLVGTVILAASGNVEEAADGDLSLTLIALLQLPLWAGYLGMPWLAARTKGHGVVRDFGLRMRAWDPLVGGATGLAAQLVAIPLLYFLLFALTDALGWDIDKDVSGIARDLADQATDPVGVVLLVLITVVGAPVVEELFFRGLVLRSIEKRFGPRWALWGSSIVFAAVHVQALQFPALLMIGLVLGWLALRTGRLGPSICAHLVFNGTATLTLLTADFLPKAVLG